jgi:hypothetical protein
MKGMVGPLRRPPIQRAGRAPGRRPIRPSRLILPIVAAALAVPDGTMRAQPAGPPGAPPDPWATMRGCQSVLGRFASCGADKQFRAQRDRWVAAGAADKAAAAEAGRRLKSWTRARGRRAQCAAWARREGAAEHVGEGAPLAQLAARGSAVPCPEFARKLDEDGWLPAALVDARID